MKLNGWLRLWIVTSSLYLCSAAFVTYSLWSTPETTRHHPAFYYSMSEENRESLYMGRSSDSEWSRVFEEAERRGMVERMDMPNGHQLLFRTRSSQPNKDTVAKAYWDVVIGASEKNNRETLIDALAWGLLPVFGIFGLGWAIGWIRQGFKGQ